MNQPRTLAEALLGAVGQSAQNFGAQYPSYMEHQDQKKRLLAQQLLQQQNWQADQDLQERQFAATQQNRQDAANRDRDRFDRSTLERGLSEELALRRIAVQEKGLAARMAKKPAAKTPKYAGLTRPQATSMMNRVFNGQAAPINAQVRAGNMSTDEAAPRLADIYSQEHRAAFFSPDSLAAYYPEAQGQIDATPQSFWGKPKPVAPQGSLFKMLSAHANPTESQPTDLSSMSDAELLRIANGR